MAKGVQNNHKSDIVISVKDGPDVVLKPGENRLTPEQYRAIREVKVIENYFGIKLLEDVKLTEPAPEEAKPEGKPLDKMNKEELIAKAVELGLTIEADDTKAVIFGKIQAALA